MHSLSDGGFERSKESKLLSEMRKERRRAIRSLDPGQKMLAAFSLSVEARKMLMAGFQAQGFTEEEIRTILRSKRR